MYARQRQGQTDRGGSRQERGPRRVTTESSAAPLTDTTCAPAHDQRMQPPDYVFPILLHAQLVCLGSSSRTGMRSPGGRQSAVAAKTTLLGGLAWTLDDDAGPLPPSTGFEV